MRDMFATDPEGGRFQVLASAAQTGGAFGLVVAEITPDDGPPRHVHYGEDETFYVLDGRMRFVIGDREVEAGPGGLVFAPAGIAHHFTVATPTARFLTLVTPGGLEAFFETLAAVDDPDPDLMLRLAAEYRFEILTPPLQPQR